MHPDSTPLLHFCRFLAIPLLSAERAWAMAMEIKGQLAAGPEVPKRMHLQRRLWKAAAWGAELTRLAAARGDARTGAPAAGARMPALRVAGH